MLSRLRTTRITCPGIARTCVVALLALVLLAGLIPSGALSAAQTCKMACCAAKAPHEAGACNAVIANAGPAQPAPDIAADAHAAHHGGMEMSVTSDETATEAAPLPDHYRTAEHSSTQQRATQPAPPRSLSVAAQAFTRPCSAECAAAVLSLMQLRRPRGPAALANTFRPRPPTLDSRAESVLSLLPSSAERRRQSRPRAPPAPLVQPSA